MAGRGFLGTVVQSSAAKQLKMANGAPQKVRGLLAELNLKEDEDDRRMDLSFSGAGFMGCYYFGVVDCWNKYIPRERVRYVAGASAGSLIAAYYLMDMPMGPCIKSIIELIVEVRRRPLGVFDRSHQIVDVLPRTLDGVFPEDAHKRVSGRLFVCMTRLKDMKKVIVSHFDTRQELIDALNCSCFIPVWSGNHVATYRGVRHIDGGFSDNLPVFDEHTIRICCFSGASDISPYDRAKLELLSGRVLNTPLYFNFANFRRFRKALFPPPPNYFLDLLERGFHDTKDFILSNDLIQCDKCYKRRHRQQQPFYSKITPTISPAATPRSLSPAVSFSDLSKLGDDHDEEEGASKLDMAIVDGHLSATNVLAPAGRGLRLRPDHNHNQHHQHNQHNHQHHQHKRQQQQLQTQFNHLLRDRLEQVSPDSGNEELASAAANTTSGEDSSSNGSGGVCGLAAPSIVVEEHSSAAAATARAGNGDENRVVWRRQNRRQSLADGEGAGRGPAPAFLLGRRRTLADIGNTLAPAAADTFRGAPSPLPSCPPSPNLDRRCGDCIRLRQEARLGLVCDQLRAEAERHRTPEDPLKDSTGLRGKLTSPLRWLRQWGVKTSYTLVCQQQPPQQLHEGQRQSDGPAEQQETLVK